MSDLWRTVRSGGILEGETLIDCHCHMGPWYNFAIPKDPWAAGMIAAFDTCGIRKAICAPHVSISLDAPQGNRIISEVVERYPERFEGYCTVNPNYPERELIDEMEKYLLPGPVSGRRLRGIKIHPAIHSYPADGPNYGPVWSFAAEHGIPVLAHTWDGARECDPGMFPGIAKQFRGVQVILGHSGATAKGIDSSITAARENDGVYLDLTSSFLLRGMLEKMASAVGVDRILFGTDVPFLDCRPRIGYVCIARLTDDEKRAILGLNAMRLFRLS